VRLTTHLHPVPRLRMRGTKLLFPLNVSAVTFCLLGHGFVERAGTNIPFNFRYNQQTHNYRIKNILHKETVVIYSLCDNCAFVGYNKNNKRCTVPVAYRGGGVVVWGFQPPPPRNSEGPPESCQTQPDCANCYKYMNLGRQHPRCSEKRQ